MNYQCHYDRLIIRGVNRTTIEGLYYENHHIIPICLGGSDVPTNLVKLTAEEHYIAHALLAKIYKNTLDGYKLICAFRFMSVDSHNGARINNKSYSWARKLFSLNNPCKKPEIKAKISNSLNLYYASELYQINKLTIQHKPRFGFRIERKEFFCECGCGETFIKLINSNQRYIKDHYALYVKDIEKELKHSITVKENLANLTKEEMTARMKNSFGSCDHVLRGNAISKAKKGKVTNQQELEIVKYGSMTDIEFEEFLLTKSYRVHTRMRNKRKIYNDRINIT